MLFYVATTGRRVGTIELRESLGIRAENTAQSMLLAICQQTFCAFSLTDSSQTPLFRPLF